MDSWLYDMLRPDRPVGTEADVLAEVSDVARTLGFEHCAIGIRFPLPATQPRMVALNTYPDAWQRRYAAQGYLGSDPSVAHCSRSRAPLVWSDRVFDGAPQLWSEARSFGLNVGWAQACHDGLGVSSMLTLARSSEALGATERAHREGRMQLLATCAHHALLAACRERLARELACSLTERETEVLRWAADGKAGNDIALILGISQATVRFHVKNALVKLQVPNMVAAVTKAALLGLLQARGPGDTHAG